jgi:fucose permease
MNLVEFLNKLVNILVIAVGSYLVISHDKSGRETAESLRDKILPLKKATPKEYSTIDLIIGIILCLVGTLALFGVIRIKGPV